MKQARPLLAALCAAAWLLSGCSRTSPVRTAGDALGPATAGYEWNLPAGFPVPRVPADNPMTAAKVELGRQLFYDTRLSANGTYACASCHQQRLAFTDGRALAVGVTHELQPTGSMTLTNVAYNASYTWANPDLRTLESQARVPMFRDDPVELGLAGHEDELLARLRQDPRYGELLRAAFPEDRDPFTVTHLIKAIASFERTLVSGGSAYDRLVYGGEMSALSASARRGMRLFYSERLACAGCHSGFNFSGPVQFEGAASVKPEFHNTGLYNIDGRGGYPPQSRGLIEFTGRRRDMGRFRAPTLRNIERTAPYMHDGSLDSLHEVIEHYAAGGRTIHAAAHAGNGSENPHKSEHVRGFAISRQEKEDLVNFLESLTDHSFVSDPRFGDPFREQEES